MTDTKREVLHMQDSNLAKLNVSRGENLAEIYVQNNNITELDLTANLKLEVLDCTGNPIKKFKACVPGSNGMFLIELGAVKGGTIGVKYGPGYQTYIATPDEGYEFAYWVNELGDMASNKPVFEDAYGTARLLIAWFRKAR
ncbi:MAG: hypothetical protein IKT62_06445 [Firmicutes bacterium]|nr:hypothetical protein [Bacillota bacterium]